VARPGAADDFAAIRARLEELRRDRARVWGGSDPLGRTTDICRRREAVV